MAARPLRRCCCLLTAVAAASGIQLPGFSAWKRVVWCRHPLLLQEIEAASVELEAAVDAQSRAKQEKDERIRELEALLDAARCVEQARLSCLAGPCLAAGRRPLGVPTGQHCCNCNGILPHNR